MKDNHLEKQIERALMLQQTGQVDAAMVIFKEILNRLPQQPDALHGIGLANVQQGNIPQGIVFLQKAVQIAPKIAEFHNNLANAYKAIGKTKEAMTHYEEALRLKPTYPEAYNNLGALLYQLGKFQEAALLFQKALRMNRDAVNTHYNLANCYIQLDRLLDAIAHYEEVLKQHPSHLGALHNLGITLCTLKRFSAAQPLLSQVVEREPNNIDALFHLGLTYSASSNLLEAQSCYKKILALDPNHGNSHHNLATILLQLNNIPSALSHYQQALKIQPENKTAKHMIDALLGKTSTESPPAEYIQALFDQYAYNYDQHVKDKLKYQVPALLRGSVTPYLHLMTSPMLIIVDIGCGSGLCAPLFADIAGKLIGIDLSPNMLEVARQHGGYHKLYCIDILTFLKNAKAEYDMIISADVFVYFSQLDEVFLACFQALKPGGLFCFSIENLTEEEIASHPENNNFQLRKTGRIAHHPKYIVQLSQSLFTIEVEKEVILRYQEDNPVRGNIYVLRK